MLGSSCSPCCGTWYCCNPLSCPDYNDLFSMSIKVEAQTYVWVGILQNVACDSYGDRTYNRERCMIFPGEWYSGDFSLPYSYPGLPCGSASVDAVASRSTPTSPWVVGPPSLSGGYWLGWQRNTTKPITGTVKTLAQMQCTTNTTPTSAGCPSYPGEVTDVENYFVSNVGLESLTSASVTFDPCNPTQGTKVVTATQVISPSSPWMSQGYATVSEQGSLSIKLTLTVSLK